MSRSDLPFSRPPATCPRSPAFFRTIDPQRVFLKGAPRVFVSAPQIISVFILQAQTDHVTLFVRKLLDSIPKLFQRFLSLES